MPSPVPTSLSLPSASRSTPKPRVPSEAQHSTDPRLGRTYYMNNHKTRKQQRPSSKLHRHGAGKHTEGLPCLLEVPTHDTNSGTPPQGPVQPTLKQPGLLPAQERCGREGSGRFEGGTFQTGAKQRGSEKMLWVGADLEAPFPWGRGAERSGGWPRGQGTLGSGAVGRAGLRPQQGEWAGGRLLHTWVTLSLLARRRRSTEQEGCQERQ